MSERPRPVNKRDGPRAISEWQQILSRQRDPEGFQRIQDLRMHEETDPAINKVIQEATGSPIGHERAIYLIEREIHGPLAEAFRKIKRARGRKIS
ncbi:MAG: hypothetical protein NUV69_02985 [Candidatus Curtissbacteria bacterium]|nr:hypothetical protein [Candidatus Curtissbacteria bacterium]